MAKKNVFRSTCILLLSIFFILSCQTLASVSESTEQQEPPVESGAEETRIALGIAATRGAEAEMTVEALEEELRKVEEASPYPTYTPQETYTPYPTATGPEATSTTNPSAIKTAAPDTSQDVVLEVKESVQKFYCYQEPYELTITVKVADINRGISVWYHIVDKNSNRRSDTQNINLSRWTSDSRRSVIIGGGSSKQNLQFPPMMGESWFVYQIITDDGKYRSEIYDDITFFPCAQ